MGEEASTGPLISPNPENLAGVSLLRRASSQGGVCSQGDGSGGDDGAGKYARDWEGRGLKWQHSDLRVSDYPSDEHVPGCNRRWKPDKSHGTGLGQPPLEPLHALSILRPSLGPPPDSSLVPVPDPLPQPSPLPPLFWEGRTAL